MASAILNKDVAQGILSSLLQANVKLTDQNFSKNEPNDMNDCATLFSKIYFDNGFDLKDEIAKNYVALNFFMSNGEEFTLNYNPEDSIAKVKETVEAVKEI